MMSRAGIAYNVLIIHQQIIITAILQAQLVIALEVISMIEIVLRIQVQLLIIIKIDPIQLEIIFSLDFKTFAMIIM